MTERRATQPVEMTAADGETAASYKFVFVLRNYWYLKFFDSVFERLTAIGHHVHVVVERDDDTYTAGWTEAMRRLAAACTNLTFGRTPRRRDHLFVDLAYWINRGLDYVRFFDAQFDKAPILRRRAGVRGWGVLHWIAARPWAAQPWVGRLLARAFVAAEAAVMRLDRFEPLYQREAPDLVVVTPLVTLGAAQADAVVAAQRLGIPTAVAVGSWDHLSSKARIRTPPDCLVVWNETQRREAVEYHGFPAERVAVTGAQCFDQWFDRSPSRSRDEFCHSVGLPADRPVILYVGSSLFWNSPNEAEFIARWARAMRSCPHAVLRDASILVRPHPKRGYEWDSVDHGDIERMVVWPPRGQAPLDAESKATYFDSLFHSAAVVGLNTSAQIEAGLIGRPVYTVLLPEFWDNQEGTLHFRYLLELEGGLLRAARSLDQHFDQLADGISDPERSGAMNRAFVAAFVRPRGLDVPATDVFVSELCRLAAARRPEGPARAPFWAPLLRCALIPAALATRGTAPPKWVDQRHRRPGHVPLWAWRARRVTEPLAPYFPGWLGDERGWRERSYEQKAEQRERERQRLEAERARTLEERRRQRAAREGAERERRRTEAVLARERAEAEKQAQLQRKREIARQAQERRAIERRRAKQTVDHGRRLRKTARRTFSRTVSLLRGGARVVYHRLHRRNDPPAPSAPPADVG